MRTIREVSLLVLLNNDDVTDLASTGHQHVHLGCLGAEFIHHIYAVVGRRHIEIMLKHIYLVRQDGVWKVS